MFLFSVERPATWPIVVRQNVAVSDLAQLYGTCLELRARPAQRTCLSQPHVCLFACLCMSFRTKALYVSPYTLRFCPLFEHAELSVCTPAHIGKAAMAAIVATKPKVVQEILFIRKRCATKSHASLRLTASQKNHYFESGKAALAAMAGESSKVTHKDFFETNR